MKTKRIIQVLTCAFALYSCSDDEGGKATEYLSNVSTGIQLAKVLYHPDTTYSSIAILDLDPDTIAYNHCGLVFRFDFKSTYANGLNWNFLPTAFASQPTRSVYSDRIKSINLTSNQDYDSTHHAGSLLNDLVSVVQDQHITPLEDFNQQLQPFRDNLVLIFNKPPVVNSNHIFYVDFTQVNQIDIELKQNLTTKSTHLTQ